MDQQELARLFYLQILKIHRFPAEVGERNSRLYLLLNRLFYEFTKEENLQFTTSFARITYGCHKFKIDNELQWLIHHFRKLAQKVYYKNGTVTEQEYLAGLQVVASCTAVILPLEVPEDIKALAPETPVFVRTPVEVVAHKDYVRMVILDHDKNNQYLIGREEDSESEEPVRIKYSQTGRNDLFDSTVEAIDQHWNNKAIVNLLDVQIEEDGSYVPAMIILEPDYLLDVTSISETFQSFGTEPYMFLLKKFLPMQSSIPLMLGNIANYFLDELLQNPEAKFETIFPGCFQLNPVAFSMFNDIEIREIMYHSQRHFNNLKRVIIDDLPNQNIHAENCYLEPSFYSEKYGIQGRLDVLYNPDENDDFAIVELKSGSPFSANRYGLSRNHYVQTLLYDLLIKSVYGGTIESANYILYSKLEMQNLKFAPPLEIQQKEALKVRNEMMAIEQQLTKLDQTDLSGHTVIDYLQPKNFPKASGFLKRDLFFFSEVVNKLSPLERNYFLSFISFVSKEHQLAKTGEQGIDTVNGLAALWLNHFYDKQDNFDIISHLEVKENKTTEADPVLVFLKTEQTNNLANFRQGDIAVLYPSSSPEETVLNNQIFKCSIVHLDNEKIKVRLRSRQFNDFLFKNEQYWNLERDLIDSSFTTLYRSLFAFLQYETPKKQLLLTTRPPEQVTLKKFDLPTNLSAQQQKLLGMALSAKDYFLLVGPPGTGKTKFMLRELVHYLYYMTKESVLLLAYTNRAVDEMCEAIHDFAGEEYIRIGSRYSTDPRFRGRLFSTLTSNVKKRADLKEIIQSHRIYVSTVSSMSSKHDLMKLKKFNRVIIDEASQILEPLLVGMLPMFDQFILIGDHKQLPAVVMQSKTISKVDRPDLLEIGLSNRRNSLFERLYDQCQKNNWDWAYGMLTNQGRMHEDISAFPNKMFYDGRLDCLPENCQPGLWQSQPLEYTVDNSVEEVTKLLSQNRVVHFSSAVDDISRSNKTNIHEARWIGELVDRFSKLYAANGLDFTTSTIGVITPYRAQIAQIRNVLEEYGKGYEDISVDTVERYQGGARDIILISLSLNVYFQMDSLVSLSDDGTVDRKLNVALTRARKHLVVVGNRQIMQMHPIYKSLVDFIGVNGAFMSVEDQA